MEAPTPLMVNSNNTPNGQTPNIKNSSNEFLEEFEVLEDKKNYTYFLVTHLEYEDNSIEIYVDPKNKYSRALTRIYHLPIDDNNKYVCNIYKITTKDIDNIRRNIEIKIYSKKDKTEFESKNTININKNNFLGLIKFENYRGWLGTYTAPLSFNLTPFQIINILNEALLVYEQIKYTDEIYYDFLNFSLDLYYANFKNKIDVELYVLLYINIIKGNYGLYIHRIYELLYINESNPYNKYKFLMSYKNELDNYYTNQNNFISKFQTWIKNNTFVKDIEFYLKRFYTIYIYTLYLLKQNIKIENIFKDLLENECDNLILSKLYITEFHSFYKSIHISNDIKLKLIDKLINSSEDYNHLSVALSLISDFIKKNFVKMLEIICKNYGKINDICFREKKRVNIKDYISQSTDDNLNKIQEFFNIIFTNKKQLKYNSISFSIDILYFFIDRNYNSSFITFLENKLLETCISSKDLNEYLLFSSKNRNKDIILTLQLVINNFEIFNSTCKIERNFISINDYIQPKGNDDLMKLKDLISTLVEKQKSAQYNSIKINVKLFELYSNSNEYDHLKFVQSIINIIKKIDVIDEESIGLKSKIHNVGIKMIREGKMDGEKLILFLKEDEILYNEKRICDLISTTSYLNQENNLRKDQCMLLERENNERKRQIEQLKTEVNTLRNENKSLENKIYSLQSDYRSLQSKINSLSFQINK